MQTRVDEIADKIYRLCTLMPGAGGSAGFTFNQFLIDADEPLLFHTGMRSLFASVSTAAATVIDLKRLRWITYSHAEADECGSLNDWLAAAPQATAAQGRFGCAVWLSDQALRPPRALADNEVIDLGGKRVRHLSTPHVPHAVDASLLYEETTGTLFCSDLFTQMGDAPALTDGDVMEAAIAAEKVYGFTSLTPRTAPTIRRLAALAPRTIAIMHGSSVAGANTVPSLEALAGYYETQLRQAMAD
ncbi:MAG: MBL fold metallo-hydrolase [Alphaproteobacteria bacterium]|nr:MBL fold metallo-hydrolase [Alphaproteobacteria bacterium]